MKDRRLHRNQNKIVLQYEMLHQDKWLIFSLMENKDSMKKLNILSCSKNLLLYDVCIELNNTKNGSYHI